MTDPRLTFRPLTPEAWADLETLFGPKGACGGCWCMAWRLPRARFTREKGEGNRRSLKALVDAGRPVGVLAYRNAEPVGWCAVAPRADIYYLAHSRTLRPPDTRPVWSITCFFIRADARGQGISRALIEAAAAYARSRGAATLEAYPLTPGKTSIPAAFAWTGLPHPFLAAGFEPCPTTSPSRLLLRRVLGTVGGQW